ncbi:MAG: hypothetical protein JXA19_01950 [Anaerolineales bacterium]|nr:hypothetical protein [Anaerolineales bacterium]
MSTNEDGSSPKRIFISADHGLAIVYFLQSDVVKTLLENNVEVVLLTDEVLVDQIQASFGQPGLTIESLRMKEAKQYAYSFKPTIQFWVDFLRRAGASNRINLEAVDSYIYQVEEEAQSRRKQLFPLMKGFVWFLRRSRFLRKALIHFQKHFIPGLYTDLFEKYNPDLVIASTPGWRYDRYLLREADKRGITTAAAIVGWDNSSSYNLSGAVVDWITCWSEIQKEELVLGSDWDPEKVNVGGIPSYDGYFHKQWLMSKEEYYNLHGLDPSRKLISYASSFITFSPNIQNIEALAELISGTEMVEPSQLLVRLHPNHFMDVDRFAREKEQVFALAQANPYVHVVEPIPLGGELGYYSGEDMPEKTSMMAYSDVFVTVYSTMVVEASIHDRPVVSLCLDSPVGWPGKFTLPLSKIGGWPTHSRFRYSESGKVALKKEDLTEAVNYFLANPQAGLQQRRDFIQRECTFTDGQSGKRTGEFFLSILNSKAD